MQVYVVGGAVRDQILGIKSSDRDYVVTGATAAQMLKSGYKQVGHDFPVFLHPKTGEEYALARTERKQGHGYTGFICQFGPEVSLEQDLLRRDLTINAIAQAEDGTLIDPYGGIDDLKHKILRHVSPAFSEDPLRVLRVARFAAKLHNLGFTIAPETLDLMRSMAESGELASLTPERVWIELNKALTTDSPHIFISTLRYVNALKAVMPEVDALFGVPGPARWHPEIDSGVHTLMTLKHIAKETADPATRFAMLCHDLGKGVTPKRLWPHHPKHHETGLKPLNELCTRLKVPVHYAELAKLVMFHHSFMHHIYRFGAEGMVSLLDHLDAWRRPERILPFLQCCKCDFLGRKNFEHRTFARVDYVMKIFKLCNTVSASGLAAQGFRGREIAEMVHLKRVMITAQFIAALPKDELNDKAYAPVPNSN